MRMNNPVFSNIRTNDGTYDAANQATYKGVTFKTLFFLLVTAIAASITGYMLFDIQNITTFSTFLIISAIVGFISVIIGRSSVRAAKYCGVIYGVCEGVFIGTLTGIAEFYYNGIGIVAAGITGIIFAVMLALFATGVIRNYSKVTSVCMAMGLSLICILLFVTLGSIFSSTINNVVSNSLPILIGLSAFMIIYGCVTLLMNFFEVSYLVQSGCDKEYEWSASLGLLVSILYIYIQVLRLLIILADLKNN